MQTRAWLWRLLDDGLEAAFRGDAKVSAQLPALERQVEASELSAPRAARALLDLFAQSRATRRR